MHVDVKEWMLFDMFSNVIIGIYDSKKKSLMNSPEGLWGKSKGK